MNLLDKTNTKFIGEVLYDKDRRTFSPTLVRRSNWFDSPYPFFDYRDFDTEDEKYIAAQIIHPVIVDELLAFCRSNNASKTDRSDETS